MSENTRTSLSRTEYSAYERSALFILLAAFRDVAGPQTSVSSMFSVRKGLYLEARGCSVTDELLARVQQRMEELVEEDRPFVRHRMRVEDARRMFRETGMEDKDRLMRFRRASGINLYELDGFFDYFYGPMLTHSGAVRHFELRAYGRGFLLLLPRRSDMTKVASFQDQPKLYQTLLEAEDWNRKLGVHTVAGLNERICRGRLEDLILVQEALQEHKIAQIAREIADRKDVRFVMIAGPSSSGKTTFSHRLSIQLRALGLTPHPIAVDDYFVDRELTPLDEDGKLDFEALECVDLAQFNADMSALLAGEEIPLPKFDFVQGKRGLSGETLRLGEKDILIIEGIHALNDQMSLSLPAESKFRIYISALTTLNIDEHNRITTSDARLIRRMTRDHAHRGATGQSTIARWESVRRGEERNIFPFQEQADVVFNSALVYELAVLKPKAEPILFNVPEDSPEGEEARRLLKFLDYFLPVGPDGIPSNSVLREFVGGSCFPV